ncbi:hypothetical protein [Kordiimonas marina]|uniref:hypothetical protein n=1 Tax=Kordiimonas marina TaxID=2872312 RepID=UPI001FF13B44|nr:hypothetical protein [Kordiimonas marina]MCJ9429144.1 hypothetical protein [Kordiimonas marina]
MTQDEQRYDPGEIMLAQYSGSGFLWLLFNLLLLVPTAGLLFAMMPDDLEGFLWLLWVMAPHIAICFIALALMVRRGAARWGALGLLCVEAGILLYLYGPVAQDPNGALNYIFGPLWHWGAVGAVVLVCGLATAFDQRPGER